MKTKTTAFIWIVVTVLVVSSPFVVDKMRTRKIEPDIVVTAAVADNTVETSTETTTQVTTTETTTVETTTETTTKPVETTTEKSTTEKTTLYIESKPHKYIAGTFKLTVYTPSSDNGVWGYQTATGVTSQHLRTCAVDPSVIPLGSTIRINGREFKAIDTGSKVKGNIVDIFFDGTPAEADAWLADFGNYHEVEIL